MDMTTTEMAKQLKLEITGRTTKAYLAGETYHFRVKMARTSKLDLGQGEVVVAAVTNERWQQLEASLICSPLYGDGSIATDYDATFFSIPYPMKHPGFEGAKVPSVAENAWRAYLRATNPTEYAESELFTTVVPYKKWIYNKTGAEVSKKEKEIIMNGLIEEAIMNHFMDAARFKDVEFYATYAPRVGNNGKEYANWKSLTSKPKEGTMVQLASRVGRNSAT